MSWRFDLSAERARNSRPFAIAPRITIPLVLRAMFVRVHGFNIVE